MEGHLGNLSNQEETALQKFKQICSDLLTQEHQDDHFCLRWLRARNFDPDAAKSMLEKSLDFRRRWRLDQLATEYKMNKVLSKIYCGGICGFNKNGGCVTIYPLAHMQPRNALRCARRSEVIRVVLQRMEICCQIAREQSKKLGRNIESHTIIFDVGGFDVLRNLSASDISVFVDLLSAYELNYPENLDKAIVINAPPVFSMFFNVLKPLLNGRTLSKVEIHGRDPAKWQAALLQAIDADQLPVRFGGQRRGIDGDEDCKDCIIYIEKLNDEIIDELKSKVNPEELCINLNVGRRSTQDYVATVDADMEALQIEFETYGYDMGFSLLRKGLNGNEVDEEILPNKRYRSHEGTVMIRRLCEKGQYILRFDNTYSTFRSKQVSLTINRIPAAEFNEKMAVVHEP